MNKFGLTHYVPILRWKQAEQIALARLYDNDSRSITPLIELVPGNFERKVPKVSPPKFIKLNTEDVINNVGGQISKCWGERPFYIDLSLISGESLYQRHSHFLSMFSQYASTLKLSLIPVVGIGKDKNYLSATMDAMHIHKLGICLRLSQEDITRPTLPSKINTLLTSLQTSPEYVDLIVDFRDYQQNLPTFINLYNLLPDIEKYRNYIVAGGAFPPDLSDLRKNNVYQLPRSEWTLWKEQAIDGHSAKRLPLYSDYTIQHPHFRDRKGPTNISASIRYTSDNFWVIMRGESINAEGGPGTAQWPANAALLSEREEYCGDNFSYGDAYIKAKVAAYDHPGTPTTWLEAGINHHITFVVRQLDALFGTLTAV